jgi:L-fuculose-phosphate aldolase
MYLAEFRSAGLALAKSGLVQGSSGNLSLRLGERIIITRTGSNLAGLSESDLIETGLERDDAYSALASSELSVHRAIYLATDAGAIAHSHAPGAVALSLGSGLTDEARVVGKGDGIIPGAYAQEIAAALKEKPIAVVRGHGPFVSGTDLKAACQRMLAFEQACLRLCRAQGLKARPAAGE